MGISVFVTAPDRPSRPRPRCLLRHCLPVRHRGRGRPRDAGRAAKKPAGNQELDIDTRTRNSLLRDLRTKGERGFALLTQRWTVLQHITATPPNHRDDPRRLRRYAE